MGEARHGIGSLVRRVGALLGPGYALPVVVAHHILLGLAVAALAGAAVRLASYTGAEGLQRIVAAAVFGAAFAVAEALGLGLAGLGASSLALAVAAGLTWAGGRALRAPAVAPRDELIAWWANARPLTRLSLVAALGAWATWSVWLVRFPGLGADSMIYHLPEIIGWVHNGHPGSTPSVFPGIPVGSYPLTNEVLVEWGSAISRSFVPVILIAPAMVLLLATAGWTGLRSIRVPTLPTALTVATICLTPALTHWQMNGPHTDLPAMAWLACAGTLCAGSRQHPRLLVPMTVAAGLAVGTKTTALPLMALLTVIAATMHRERLRPLAPALLAGSGLAFVVGGVWYLRNLLRHGSPFWPFVPAPWGDSRPQIVAPSGHVLKHVDVSFLDRPGATLTVISHHWADPFGGSLLMLGLALLAPLVVRRLPVVFAAAATGVSLLLWMNSPFTGLAVGFPNGGTAFSTMRYLLPTFLAAGVTLALASREGRVGQRYALGALAASLAATAWQLFHLHFPSVPPVEEVAGGALAAALLVVLLTPLLARRLPWPSLVRLGRLPAVVAGGAVLALGASGFLERQRAVTAPGSRQVFSARSALMEWFVRRPGFQSQHWPIAFTVVTNAALAGDRLQHRIDLIPAGEGCARVVARLRSGWVVANRAWPVPSCLTKMHPRWSGGEFLVYGGEPPGLVGRARQVRTPPAGG